MEYVLEFLKKAGFNSKELHRIKKRLLAKKLEDDNKTLVLKLNSNYLTGRAIISGLKRGDMQIIDECLEKQCPCCNEFSPYDLEFFHSNGKDGKLKSKCKACYEEERNPRKIFKPIIIGQPNKGAIK